MENYERHLMYLHSTCDGIAVHKYNFVSNWCTIAVWQVHRITQWLRLKGMSGGHLVQPLYSSRVTSIQLPKIIFRQLLNISKEDSSTPPGNLCQYSVTFIVKKSYQTEYPVFQFVPLPLGLSLGHWALLTGAWLSSPCTLPSYILMKYPLSHLFQSEQPQVSLSTFPSMSDAPVP